MDFISLLLATAFLLYPAPTQAYSRNTAPAALIQVALCESGGKQFYANGDLVVSKTNDIGLYQINERWISTAQALGYDIFTPEGNTAFALWLYHKDGLSDWSASKPCWDKAT